jgi:hypothetical protein
LRSWAEQGDRFLGRPRQDNRLLDRQTRIHVARGLARSRQVRGGL